MRLLNRYLSINIIRATLLVLFILLGIECFMEFMTQLPDIGKKDYSILKAALYVLMQLPTDLYQFFPMAGFLGSLIGLGRLASSSQLIVMQSAGVSIAQVTWSVIKTAWIMIFFITVMGEMLSPFLQQKGQKIKNIAMHRSVEGTDTGLWFRDKNAFLYMSTVTSKTHIGDVYRFVLNKEGGLKAAEHSDAGYLKARRWVLENAKSSNFSNNRVTVEYQKTVPLKLMFDPLALQESKKEMEQNSLMGLYRFIHYRYQVGLNVTGYVFSFWQRLIQPITTTVMICLAVPFIFGSLRTVSMGLRVLTGIIIGFAFYIINQFFGPFAMVYQMPALLAAIMPTLLFLLIGIGLHFKYAYWQ